MDTYKEKYEQALFAMKQRVEAGIIDECYAEAIFPELREESEDEKIRKRLINAFKSYQNPEIQINPDEWNGIKVSEILNWLNRQK